MEREEIMFSEIATYVNGAHKKQQKETEWSLWSKRLILGSTELSAQKINVQCNKNQFKDSSFKSKYFTKTPNTGLQVNTLTSENSLDMTRQTGQKESDTIYTPTR